MTSQEQEGAHSKQPDEDRDADKWIDESMAEGDIANGEGDPEEASSGDGER